MEIEIKLQCDKGAFLQIRRDGRMGRILEETRLNLTAKYYDTKDQALGRLKWSLRFRFEGKAGVCTLKGPGEKGEGGLSTRFERNVRAGTIKEGVYILLSDNRLPQTVKDALKKELVHTCSTQFRRVMLLMEQDGLTYELCFDQGHLENGRSMQSFSELELELKEGDVSALLALSSYLQGSYQLKPLEESKHKRALALKKDNTLLKKAGKRFLLGVCALLLYQVVYALAAAYPSFSYALNTFSTAVIRALGAVIGLIPIPLSELLLIAAALGLPAYLIVRAVKGRWRAFLLALSSVFLSACILLLAMCPLFSVRYTLPSLKEQMKLGTFQYTPELLYEVTEQLMQLSSQYGAGVARGADGRYVSAPPPELSQRIHREYARLGEQYPVFQALSYPKIKGSFLLSTLMSYVGTSGYFFPVTGESIVSRDVPAVYIPVTCAHEAAHSYSVMLEDEANFAAFWSAITGDDLDLKYSACVLMYVYCSNALLSVDPKGAQEIAQGLSPGVQADLQAVREHDAKYDTKVRDLGNQINSGYIRSTGQTHGVKSYGMVVDMIVAYYRSFGF